MRARWQTDAESQQRSDANVDRMTEQRQQRVDDRTRQGEVLARHEAHLQALKQVQASVEANAKLDPWLRAQGPRESCRACFASWWLNPAGRLRSRRCYASACRASRSASSTRSAGWPRMRRPRALRSIRPVALSRAMRAICRRWRGSVGSASWCVRTMPRLPRCSQTGSPMYSLPMILQRRSLRGANCLRAGSSSYRRRTVCRGTTCTFTRPTIRLRGCSRVDLEIENLEREVRAQRLIAEQATAAVARAEAELKSAQQARDTARQDAEARRAQMHALQLESVRLEELIDRVRHRTRQIDTEVQEIEANEREARLQREQADARFEQLDAELSPRQEAVEARTPDVRGVRSCAARSARRAARA